MGHEGDVLSTVELAGYAGAWYVELDDNAG